MLINIPQHLAQHVANQLNNPVSFVILLVDKTNMFAYHRKRLVAAQKIAKNWLIYQKKKNDPTYTFSLGYDDIYSRSPNGDILCTRAEYGRPGFGKPITMKIVHELEYFSMTFS